ncbi:MAG: hypothetical protein LBE13_16765 [Bacteroidales bacterium]|jgi:hypothetical protein|nr:hypothetical protein [Bacteroidales bacterium]
MSQNNYDLTENRAINGQPNAKNGTKKRRELHQAAPTIRYFYFFLAAKPQKSPPLFCRKAAMFQK